MSETKTCSKCKLSRPMDAFARCGHTLSGLQSWCRFCYREMDRERNRRRRADPSFIEKCRVTNTARNKRRWQDPEFREKDRERTKSREFKDRVNERKRDDRAFSAYMNSLESEYEETQKDRPE